MNGSQPTPAFAVRENAGAGAIPYDDQAQRFDERVGLRDAPAKAFCAAVMDEAARAPGELVVEIGAGTGRIGVALIASGVRYAGIDVSGGMLARFRERLPAGTDPGILIQADANGPWPVDDGAAQVIFGLRSLHHLAVDHACEQALRVLRPGGVLLIGRVERGPESLHAEMREQMHRLLRTLGFTPLRAGRAAGRLIDRICRRGADALPPRTLAAWTVAKSPMRLIEDWASKRGLGGLSLPDADKRAVLSDLANWAAERFDGAEAPRQWQERLVCTGARLHLSENGS